MDKRRAANAPSFDLKEMLSNFEFLVLFKLKDVPMILVLEYSFDFSRYENAIQTMFVSISI